MKSNVVNSKLKDLVVHFFSEYCTKRDDGTCSSDGIGGLVVLPEITTVDRDSRTGTSVVDLVEEIYLYVLVSSVVNSVVLGVDVILACAVLLTKIERK